jgi:hypothetical protein
LNLTERLFGLETGELEKQNNETHGLFKADIPVGINFEEEDGGPMVESFILCLEKGIGFIATNRWP